MMGRYSSAYCGAAVLGMLALPAIAMADATAIPATQPAAASPLASSLTPNQALTHGLPELRFSSASLSDVLDFLAQASGINFSVDWRALDSAKVDKDTPITLQLGPSVTLRKALNLVLQQAGGVGTVTFYVDQGVLQITTQEEEDKQQITRTYPIGDLLFTPTDYTNAPSLDLSNNNSQSAGGGGGGGGGGGQSAFQNANTQTTNTDQTRAARAEEIITLITTTVRPEVWKVNGGTANISFFRDSLIVTAPRSVQAMLSSQYR
jgi:type II secretory pathway component GspD/PulD (secretin)